MIYLRPNSMDEYFAQVGNLDPHTATFLAGGSDLMPRYEAGRPLPEHLIDIKAIPNLVGITEGDDGLAIGALTTMEAIRKSNVIRNRFTALAQATDTFAGTQIRNRATIGGNIVNASPAGDTLPALYAFGAQLRLVSQSGMRVVSIRDFITGPGKTNVHPGEILQSVILPKSDHRSLFYKLGLRQSMAIAVVNFAVQYSIVDGTFSHLVIAAGAVAPKVVLLDKLSNAILGGASVSDSINLVDREIDPIDDLRATAAYRRKVIKNVLGHTLQGILQDDNER